MESDASFTTHLAVKKEVVDVLVHRLDIDPLPVAPPVADVIVAEQDDVVGLFISKQMDEEATFELERPLCRPLLGKHFRGNGRVRGAQRNRGS